MDVLSIAVFCDLSAILVILKDLPD